MQLPERPSPSSPPPFPPRDPDFVPAEEPIARPQFYVPLAQPTVTRVLLGLLVAVFVVEIFYAISRYGDWPTLQSTNIYALVDLGAKVNEYIAAGQYWRLFTATLLHSGILHLLFNLFALFSLGAQLEGYAGHVRFTTIYLVAGLYGSLGSYAFSPSVSVGASGAIFGVIGGVIVFFLMYRSHFGIQGRAILQNLLIVLALNLFIGFSSGFIDNWGHLGGLVGGVLVAWGILPRFQIPPVVRLGPQPMVVRNRRPFEIGWTVFCLLLFVAGVYAVTLLNYGTL